MDKKFMQRALDLAAGARPVSPRPPVGAVIVSGDEIVGEGADGPSPSQHAEIIALNKAGPCAKGATIYLSLEPCVHQGATPPCTAALIEAGVAKVVVATRDPNPVVDGRGIKALRAAGIDVTVGMGRARARHLIAPFASWVLRKRPLVTLKMAASLDGKTAAPDGSSRWITSEESRREVHQLRSIVDAVLVGSGTIVADDPSLTCRLEGYSGPQPKRIVVDSSGRTPPEAKVFDGTAPAVVLTSRVAPAETRQAWAKTGAYVFVLPQAQRGVRLQPALNSLWALGICHVLAEPGPALASGLIAEGLVDRFRFYLAPKLIGDPAAGLDLGIKSLDEARGLRIQKVSKVGPDIRVDAEPA